jgi:cell division protein FtsL
VRLRHQIGLGVLLLLLVVVSSLGVIYAKYQSRKLFVEQEILRKERDELAIELTRLLVEQSTWASPARIEKEARERLKLRMAEVSDIKIIKP